MKFSIITICRNDLAGLRLTYNSVINQSYKNYEWIVIDGNSSDGTVEFLKELNISNFNFISEPDKGLYDAMNKGIYRCTGDYMVFMNSGDLFASNETLATLIKEIKPHTKPLLIYGDSIDYQLDGKKYYRKARHHNTIYKGMFTQHQSMYFATLPKEEQFTYSYSFKYSSDYQFIIKYINLCKKDSDIMKLNIPLSQFQLGGLNEQRRFVAIREDFQIRKEDLKLHSVKNYTLLVAHYIHTLFKIYTPGFTKKIRYSQGK